MKSAPKKTIAGVTAALLAYGVFHILGGEAIVKVSHYLAAWVIARLAGWKAAESVVHYVTPVG